MQPGGSYLKIAGQIRRASDVNGFLDDDDMANVQGLDNEKGGDLTTQVAVQTGADEDPFRRRPTLERTPPRSRAHSLPHCRAGKMEPESICIGSDDGSNSSPEEISRGSKRRQRPLSMLSAGKLLERLLCERMHRHGGDSQNHTRDRKTSKYRHRKDISGC